MLGQRKTIGGIIWVGVGGGSEIFFPSSKSKQCNCKKLSTKSRNFCFFGNISKYSRNVLTFTSEGKLEMIPNYNYLYISFILHPSNSLQKTFPISACSSSYLTSYLLQPSRFDLTIHIIASILFRLTIL